MKIPISVLILTRNEEVNIGQALENVCGWADQVFVVDSYSTDKTLDIARTMGAEIVQNPWHGYAAQKNWALDNLNFRNEWVFVLDADELLSDELKQEVAEIVAAGGRGYDGFYIKWRLIFYGQWIRHSGWYPGWGLRLFKHKNFLLKRSRSHRQRKFYAPEITAVPIHHDHASRLSLLSQELTL